MHVIGKIKETWVENGRVLAIADLNFDTHRANYRLDLTPSSPSTGVKISINLEKYARSLVNKPISAELPDFLISSPPISNFSIGSDSE